jgi:hypothetical protein
MSNRALLALAWITVAAVIVAVGLDVTRRADRMRPVSAAAAPAAESAQPGGTVKAIVRLERPGVRGRYLAAALASVDETTYRESGSHLELELTPQTTFVMGSAADVGPGAIVEVAGMLDAAHVVRARRIVILTGYIKVAAD